MIDDCPICGAEEAIHILDLHCGNLDNSSLYPSVKLNVCRRCGHVYNSLSHKEKEGLINYYNDEYAPSLLFGTDKRGNRLGISTSFTIERYTRLYGLFSSYLHPNTKLLDVGCATGEFLAFLQAETGSKNLYGIDFSETYVNHGKGNIKIGCAEALPFENDFFDIVVLDQVLEHLPEPRKALKEAKRVLVDDGLLCIGVPDASRYRDHYFFDFFFFLIREHIQHFDLVHLNFLAKEEGFDLLPFGYRKTETPMVTAEMVMPILNAVFRIRKEQRGGNPANFLLKGEMKRYIAEEYGEMDRKMDKIHTLIKSQKPLYVWGIGKEFLYLYENTGFKNCNIRGLIDTNTYKQKTHTICGRKIEDKQILENAVSNSAVLITAIAHTKEIKAALSEMGYGGAVIEV